MRSATYLLSLTIIAWRVSSLALKPHYDSAIERALERRVGPPTSVGSNQINNCLNPEGTDKGTKITDCPAKITVDSQGNCGPLNRDNGCAAFCQTDVSWSYGPEIPFDASCACSDSACSITNTQSTTVTNAYSFNVGVNLKKARSLDKRGEGGLSVSDLTNAFNYGSTWTYSTSYTNATAATNTKPKVAANKCGYWTFVPYYVTTCGTLTYAPHQLDPPGFICGESTTITDWCQQTPYVSPTGAPMGETIFVARNCDALWPLGFCWQDPAYLNPGVSSNASVYQDFVDAHENFDITQPIESTPLILCEEGLHQYDEGAILPGCSADLPAGVPLSSAYIVPS